MAASTDSSAECSADGCENPHYKIMRCPSDNSESPSVYQRGYTFLPAANDAAFDLNGRDDGYDYWPERY